MGRKAFVDYSKSDKMHVTWPLKVEPGSPFPITNIPFGIFSTNRSVSSNSCYHSMGLNQVHEDANFLKGC